MPRLTVRDFSCIESAVLDLSRLTVMIGPQASGKSVLSKLVYFFQNVINVQVTGLDIETDYVSFQERVASDFKKWFPVSAWGSKKFHIEFESGPITITIDRKKSYRKPSEGFYINFSPFFTTLFDETARLAQSALQTIERGRDMHTYVRWEATWQIQRDTRISLASNLGKEYVSHQMFIPAGRAFFTTFGKAIAAFAEGGLLDPATLAFGRYWAQVRDNDIISYESHEFSTTHAKLMKEIFGGELKVDRDFEYVLSEDGRKVPISALSSGQQELLPLWMTIERYFRDTDTEPGDSSMMYIEEPEAHLFPHAQSMLVEYLTSKLYSVPKTNRRMLITTHSPYVLAKLNNLLKASIIARRASKEQVAAIARVYPRVSWLRSGDMNAYAIVDRNLINLRGDDDLINADYLDRVSDEIMNQYSKLIDIQYAD